MQPHMILLCIRTPLRFLNQHYFQSVIFRFFFWHFEIRNYKYNNPKMLNNLWTTCTKFCKKFKPFRYFWRMKKKLNLLLEILQNNFRKNVYALVPGPEYEYPGRQRKGYEGDQSFRHRSQVIRHRTCKNRS